MISLLLCLAALVIGYFTYGRLVDRMFGPDDRVTPANRLNDGVDYVPMKKWRLFLVQLLNIAGTGPIFGPLMGACFGPVVFLWIVLGSILGGAVHDYMVGMISERHDGKSIAELSGIYLGNGAKWGMRLFSVLLLLLTGTVFVNSPAALIDKLTPMQNDTLPEISLQNLHPEGLPVWPYMFVTVACGAISGFHATQSPMVSKCITSEKQGHMIFYGAMLAESVIALVWAAGGAAFYGNTVGLNGALSTLGQSGVVYDISIGMLGKVGAILAIIGVIACPITSGDTAFRSARLILAEMFHLDQKPIKNRLVVTLPLLAAAAVLTQLDFNVLWRYFSWSNQTLAMISLWVATAYLIRTGRSRFGSLVTALPATFMSAVSMTYILMAKEGLGLGAGFAYPVGIAFAAALFVVYMVLLKKHQRAAI